MKRVFNFNAGPSPMPIEVLEEMKNDLTDFRGTGMGITEISHRSPFSRICSMKRKHTFAR